MPSLRVLPLALITTLALAACGKGNDQEATTADSAEEAVPAAESTSAPPAPPAQSQHTYDVSDIERWEKGLQAEMQAVQDAAKKLAEAQDENAKLEALHAATDLSTIEAGAAAAGVDRDRYRRIRNTFSDAVSQLSPIDMEMDVKQMPPEMVEQMQQAREASAAQLAQQLPTEVFEALKSRAGELRTLDKTLVGERLKVANAAR